MEIWVASTIVEPQLSDSYPFLLEKKGENVTLSKNAQRADSVPLYECCEKATR